MEDEDKLDTAPENSVCGRGTGSGDASHIWTISKPGVDGSSATTGEKYVEMTDAGQDGGPKGEGGEQEKEEKELEVEEEEGEEEEEEDNCTADVPFESRVPDGGWGWMVALGTFIIHTLTFSLSFCFGILFSGFLLENGASSTITAWIYNLYLVLFSLSMILINPLCQEFGQRTVGFISILMASLSVILSGFSPSVSFLFFSFSLLGGVSSGLSIGIAFMVLPPYFDKKSGQANTLLVAGAPMAQMVLAPLIRHLLAVYTFKGAALIHSAIILNGLVAVSFFHPVKWHLKPSSGEKPQQDTHQALMPYENTTWTASSETPRRVVAPEVFDSVPRNLPIQRSRRSFSGSVSPAVSDVLVGSAFLLAETEESTAGMKPRDSKAFWKTLLRVVERTKSDITVLRQFRCVILAVTFMLTQTTFLNFIMMLPFVTKAADHSLQDAARCIALLGVANLVVRLVVSPLSDYKRFSIRFSIMLGYFLRASGNIGASLSSELWHFMASGLAYGLGLGFSLGMFNLAIVHYLGMENLRPTIGITGLVAAIAYPTLGPLIGVIRDTTNSFSTSLCVMAALDLFSVGLWFLMPAAQARDGRMELRLRRSCDATRP